MILGETGVADIWAVRKVRVWVPEWQVFVQIIFNNQMRFPLLRSTPEHDIYIYIHSYTFIVSFSNIECLKMMKLQMNISIRTTVINKKQGFRQIHSKKYKTRCTY